MDSTHRVFVNAALDSQIPDLRDADPVTTRQFLMKILASIRGLQLQQKLIMATLTSMAELMKEMREWTIPPLVTPLHPTPPSFNVPVQEADPVTLTSALAKLPLDPVPEPERMDMDIESPPPIILSDPSSPVPVDGTVVNVKVPAKDASYKLQPLEQIFQTLGRQQQPKTVRSRAATSPALVAAVSLAKVPSKTLASCPTTSQTLTYFPPRRVAPSAKDPLPKRVPTRPVKLKAPTSRRERWKLMMSLYKDSQQTKDPEVPVVPKEVPSEEPPKDDPPKDEPPKDVPKDVPRKASSKGTKRSKVPKTKEAKEKKKKRADRAKM